MPEPSDVESFLDQVEEREKAYDWLGAAEFYRKALSLVPEQDSSKLAEIYESLGYAFYQAAMQAESVDEFKSTMHQAVANCQRAKEFYGRLSGQEKTPRMFRCDAMTAFVGYWLATEVPEKKRLLNECWKLAKESLNGFEQAEDALEYGKTYNRLATSIVFGFALEWDFKAREKMIKEAVELGGRAIKFLSTLGDPNELAKAYAKTAVFQDAFIQYFLDLDEQEKTREKALDYWQKAKELSEKIAVLELLSSSVQVDHESIGQGLGIEDILTNFRKALEYANRTKDKFLIGRALDWLAYHTAWKVGEIENQDDRVKLVETVFHYSEEAKRQFSRISFTSPRGDATWIESPHTHAYIVLARNETTMKKRRGLLEKALETAPDMLRKAENSGYPELIHYAHFHFSNVLTRLAMMETNSDEKKRLLEKALLHGNEAIRLVEQLEPFDYWDRGINHSVSALTRSELAELAKDCETKKKMLEEAISDTESSEKLCAKHAAYYESRGIVSLSGNLGGGQYQLGRMLDRLFESSHDTDRLRRAAEAFARAAESFKKLSLTSRMAECYWKAAQIYDKLGEQLRAAENFEAASNNYKVAAEKIPQLKDFYQDHAIYMQAWSEIEKARHHHERQEYGSAEEHFEKAADLHKALKQWSYLMSNYLAWAKVEQAEDLSRKEQSEDAIQAFEQAAKLFDETKRSLQTQLDKIENPDEKQMAIGIVKATDERREYCIGRIALEEAKILDKKGDHYSSSQKYGSAAQTFEKITNRLEPEQDRKEFKLITTLSQAWQKMMLAEARASPQLYMEASQLFEQASEHSSSEKTSFLTLGHSRFCKALEAGTRFADTGDLALHTIAQQHLESAAKYYVKAGFQNASEYAKATEQLFDAYVYMDNAKKEPDPEKKTKFYTMAERVLQSSAGSFMKAEHPEKREQVLRLLEKVKEERELALSLSEVLHAPTIVSATTAFSTPTPTHESAVGLERFEHADIQANIIIRQKELKIGENLNLEIELVNAGKGPALLTKITEVIPEGFELTEKPETYRVEDSYLNMKGKRLDPLKMEEVKIVLKPKVQGVFPLKPKILYLDENGKYKSHEPEPVTITVKELGIKGWLKGER